MKFSLIFCVTELKVRFDKAVIAKAPSHVTEARTICKNKPFYYVRMNCSARKWENRLSLTRRAGPDWYVAEIFQLIRVIFYGTYGYSNQYTTENFCLLLLKLLSLQQFESSFFLKEPYQFTFDCKSTVIYCNVSWVFPFWLMSTFQKGYLYALKFKAWKRNANFVHLSMLTG